jgi:hypothetical protein
MKAIGAVLAICGALLFSALTRAANDEPRNQSQLVICIAVKAGHFAIDRTRSQFTPSSLFVSRSRLAPAQAQRSLFDDLDRALASQPALYTYALSDIEAESDAATPLNDTATAQVRDFAGSWTDFVARFDRWANAGKHFALEEIFSKALEPLILLDESTPLIFDEGVPPDFTAGQLVFRVADPIGDWRDTADYSIRLREDGSSVPTVASPALLAKVLSPLRGKLWRPSEIRARIQSFYVERGLQPNVTLPKAGEHPKQLLIRESMRVARIILPAAPDRDIDQILYVLLPEREFRRFLRNRASILNSVLAAPGSVGLRAVDYVQHLGRAAGSEPYLNLARQPIQLQQLQAIGYSVAPVPCTARVQLEGIAYMDLQVQRISDASAGQTPLAAPLLANTDGVIDSNLQDVRHDTPFVPSMSDGIANSTSNASARSRRNYVGGGILYAPGQTLKLIGLYQRSQLDLLSDRDNFSVKSGSQANGFGGVNYFADYVGFDRWHRKLSLQLTGSTDFTADRIFNTVRTDERRTGGLARAELEWFRDREGRLLRTYIEARRATLELSAAAAEQTSNLTTLETGAIYLVDRPTLLSPSTLRIEPRLRLGLGLADSEVSFARLQLLANYHLKLSSSLELDLNGRIEAASSDTPLFELPSLGGAECLRGFRTDDALGRRLWSLQNELWTPIPGTAGATGGGVREFLGRSVRLAGFIDVGGIDGTRGSQPGTRVGPGLGLRFIYNSVVLKLDWAYGLGDGALGRGRERFYFTVGTNLPF